MGSLASTKTDLSVPHCLPLLLQMHLVRVLLFVRDASYLSLLMAGLQNGERITLPAPPFVNMSPRCAFTAEWLGIRLQRGWLTENILLLNKCLCSPVPARDPASAACAAALAAAGHPTLQD